jgi:hypothetical protein
METIDPNTSEEAPAPVREKRPTKAYEPPSITELGSFLELTAGNAVSVGDISGASEAA